MTYNYDIDKDDTFSGYNKIDEVHGSIKDLQSEIGSVYDSHKANDNTVNSIKQNLVEEIINKKIKEFYDKMRGGSLPTTSQVNPETAKKIFLDLM